MKNPLLLLALVSVVPLQPLVGASLEELAGAERAAALRALAGSAASVKPITEVQLKNPVPRITPSHGELLRVIGETAGGLEPNILVETISLHKKPLPYSASAWSAAEQTALFNRITALSTLAGIQYYSESRKTTRTLYETSFPVDGPAGKKPLPDPVFAALPASLTLYARQKDLTFGDNIYRFDYRASADAIIVAQENLSPMNAGIIPAVGKNKFRSVVAVIDAGDSFLIYSASMARAVSLPGMGERISASFTNRAEAVLAWFTARAGNAYKR